MGSSKWNPSLNSCIVVEKDSLALASENLSIFEIFPSQDFFAFVHSYLEVMTSAEKGLHEKVLPSELGCMTLIPLVYFSFCQQMVPYTLSSAVYLNFEAKLKFLKCHYVLAFSRTHLF